MRKKLKVEARNNLGIYDVYTPLDDRVAAIDVPMFTKGGKREPTRIISSCAWVTIKQWEEIWRIAERVTRSEWKKRDHLLRQAAKAAKRNA